MLLQPCRNYGSTIEEYEVQHLLGKGGFARVHKAICRRTFQEVAIKVIDKKLIQSTGLSDRVRQEIEIHSRLKHPSVLQLYTFFQDSNNVYLVLELAHNGELQRFMKQELRRPFTEGEAASIVQQLVVGVLYLHSHNIMHRDISLSNLLLSKDMHIKIADFGLAAQLKRPDEKHMTMCGTPNYISPEVVSRLSHGLQADVWSVGCILYTLLVGHPPFDTDGVQSTLKKVVMSDYVIPNHLTLEAQDLIDHLLKKEPQERLSLDQVLRHPFMLQNVESSAEHIDLTPNAPIFYSQSNASSDSGIVTFASNDSQRLRSIDKYKHISQSLPQIQEEYRNIQHSPDAYSHQEACQYFICNDGGSQRKAAGIQFDNLIVKTPFSAPPTSVGVVHEHVSVPPLNTKRLQPTRYKTKNAIMSIVRNGEVVIEFIKFKGKFNEDRITDICRISGDGRRVIIYQPDPGRGIPIQEHPPDCNIPSQDCVYNYDTLPTKHWKKYIYAARFVGLVKSKTPKLTYFSEQAKCHLMENMFDFEMCYYSGEKLLKNPTNGIKLFNAYGITLSDHSSIEAKRLVNHCTECYAHCLQICNSLELVESSNNVCFPVTIGRKPITEVQPLQRPAVMRDTTNIAFSTPKSQQGSINFSISTISSTPNQNEQFSTHSVRSHALAAQQNVPIKRIQIPGIGTATELSHGVIQVQFFDGSVISVIPEAQGNGITYTQPNGASTHFSTHEELPLVVRDRVAVLPEVQMKLKTTQPVSNRKLECNAMTPKSTLSSPYYNRILI